jgi:hypothetical protein
MQTIQTDTICLAETHLDTRHPSTMSRIHSTIKCQHRKTYSRATFASSLITYGRGWKPGGTAIVSTGPTVGRILQQGSDEYGRWAWQALAAFSGRVLVVSCYQVCSFPPQLAHGPACGPKQKISAYAQQYSMIQATRVEHPDPREQFITNLGHYLRTTLNKDDKLILTGDFNSTIED